MARAHSTGSKAVASSANVAQGDDHNTVTASRALDKHLIDEFDSRELLLFCDTSNKHPICTERSLSHNKLKS
jgi:hypothetical protein